MTDSNAGSLHTAITTWSGFVYQGKVAIYHVLRLLEDLDRSSDYVLQLDSLDDFAILQNGTRISLHQVKALKSRNYSTYREALEKLKNNALSRRCNDAYFHAAQQITNKTPENIEQDHSPVKLYRYGRDPYCSVDGLQGIDCKIENKLKTLLVNIWQNDISKQSDDYAHKARIYLDQLVLKKVLDIHGIVHKNLLSDRQAAYTQTIPFSEFVTILEDDLNQKDIGEDYYFYVLLNDLHRYYQDYCIENEEGLSENELKKLSCCMWMIEGLDKGAMVQFIRNIMPHRGFKFDSLSEYKDNTFNKEEIQDAFLAMLHKLKQPELSPRFFLQWRTNDRSFAPTIINTGTSLAGTVCKKIVENALDTDLNVMFERSSLITTDINVTSITDKVNELILTLGSDDRITKWKTVSLISLNNAKEIIND